MINIMIEIGAYIFVAILLGYFFGWIITRLILKERYQNYLDEIILNNRTEAEELSKINDELLQYKKNNKHLRLQNKELSSASDTQKYVLGENNEPLDDLKKRLHSKDEIIATMTSKLSQMEEKQMTIENKYEEEIDAFMFEQIDITQKYKDLLEKFNLLKEDKGMLKNKNSWFSKLFSSSSNS
ncbi:MAG TPA: hypothetical protein EYG94_04490 [Campylobacterales bacterium]|nr:hypothetical protein [Campylobacterales bacterium]